MSDDLTARITTALNRAEQLARDAMWSDSADAAEWTYQPSFSRHERPIVADGLGDGVAIIAPENADVEGVGEHMAHWDPKAILELIAAHREVIALAARVNEHRHEHAEAESRAWLMDEVLAAIAKAHGVEIGQQ